MEKKKLFMNQATNGTTPMWNSSSFGMGMQSNDLSSWFFNSNWDKSMHQNDPFESALSSIVSSPLVSSANAISSHGGSGDTVTIKELIGRLGTICNSEEIFHHSSYINNTDNINNNSNANNLCYSTLLNSPPKLNLAFMDSHFKGRMPILGSNLANQQSLVPVPTDPVFAERAARYSCFGNRNLGGLSGQFGLNQAELLYGLMPRVESGNNFRVQSSNYMKVIASQGIVQESNKSSPQDVSSNFAKKRNAELGDFNEKSSVSEQISDGEMSMKGQKEYNPRKRKSISKGKTKETPYPSPCSSGAKVVAENNDEPSLKKGKSDEANGKQKDAGKAKEEDQDGNQENSKDSPKSAEPLKDYIHVRARRGQAIGRQSLAERVRRDKFGERMKFLQDLVPGCNKVTGKAVMLDEIINYVQSLQRQVEESNKSSPQDVSSNSAKKRNAELGDFNEKSSVSEQILDGEMSMKGQKEYNPRKRKSISRGKTKETPSPSPCSSGAKVVAENNDEPSLKKGKSDEANGKQKDAGKAKEEEQDGNQKNSKNSPKPAEPLKDYIHVRARRGQATDRHSLVGRVRREKFSERMKFLQDLVPGCNKVTEEAVMLDEIINYVQSLQRQVEESNKSSPQDVSSNSAKKRNAELEDFNEKSSVSEQIPDGEMSMKGQKEYNPRKRKSISRGNCNKIC